MVRTGLRKSHLLRPSLVRAQVKAAARRHPRRSALRSQWLVQGRCAARTPVHVRCKSQWLVRGAVRRVRRAHSATGAKSSTPPRASCLAELSRSQDVVEGKPAVYKIPQPAIPLLLCSQLHTPLVLLHPALASQEQSGAKFKHQEKNNHVAHGFLVPGSHSSTTSVVLSPSAFTGLRGPNAGSTVGQSPVTIDDQAPPHRGTPTSGPHYRH